MRSFHYSKGTQQLGPVPEDELQALFTSGQISATSLIWTEGQADWQPLRTIFPEWVTSATPAPAANISDAVDQAYCAVSGRLMPKSQMIAFGDIYVAPENRDIYLQRLSQGLPTQMSLDPAGIWPRIAANLIDGLIFTIPAFILLFLMVGMGGVVGQAGGEEAAGTIAGLGIMGIVFLITVGSFVYEALMISKKGATLGKMALKIKVVTEQNGQFLSMGQSFGRAAMKTLVPQVACGPIYTLVSLIMAISDKPLQRAIHDRTVKSVVVRA